MSAGLPVCSSSHTLWMRVCEKDAHGGQHLIPAAKGCAYLPLGMKHGFYAVICAVVPFRECSTFLYKIFDFLLVTSIAGTGKQTENRRESPRDAAGQLNKKEKHLRSSLSTCSMSARSSSSVYSLHMKKTSNKSCILHMACPRRTQSCTIESGEQRVGKSGSTTCQLCLGALSVQIQYHMVNAIHLTRIHLNLPLCFAMHEMLCNLLLSDKYLQVDYRYQNRCWAAAGLLWNPAPFCRLPP
jgi:hypothetical protein